MQFFKPENYFQVRKALEQAGRQDLIGSGCDALIPDHPPREALRARRASANQNFRGEYVHTIANGRHDNEQRRSPAGTGYRPGRKTARRRPRKAR